MSIETHAQAKGGTCGLWYSLIPLLMEDQHKLPLETKVRLLVIYRGQMAAITYLVKQEEYRLKDAKQYVKRASESIEPGQAV